MSAEGSVILPSGTVLDACDLTEQFIRASGPGGQKVNTSSTAVQLRFRVSGGRSLAPAVVSRLSVLAGSRMTREGELVIEASEFRSRQRNREAALERLDELIARAKVRPKPRRPTKPTRSSQRKRLESKKKHSSLKKNRCRPGSND